MDRIGPYRIVSSLGSGGMADVYLAERRGPSGFVKRFAVKVVKPVDAQEEEESRRRFEAEARLSGILEHPNIVRVYDFAQEPRPYLVMEYVDGVSVLGFLRKLLQVKERLAGDIAAFVVSRMCRGLEHAHVQCGPDGEPLGLIHRDVSAANVLLSFQGEVKIGDFGIAQAVDNPWKTLSGTVLGKTSYMSPEQARGEPIDARSDVFSAGVVLWELLCMRPLFPQSDPEAQRRRSHGVRPPHPCDVRPEVDHALADVAARALEPDLGARTQSAGQLADELDEWLGQHPGPPRERALEALLGRHFPRRAARSPEEATVVETAIPEAVRERIEADLARRRRDRAATTPDVDGDPGRVTPTATELRPMQIPLDDVGESTGSVIAAPIEVAGGLGGQTTDQLPALAEGEPEGGAAPTLVVGSSRPAPRPEAGGSARPRRIASRRPPRRVAEEDEETGISVKNPPPRRRPLGLGVLVVAIVVGAGALALLGRGRQWLGRHDGDARPLAPSMIWSVRSEPEGFQVYVDDRLVGTTPFDLPWSAVPSDAAVTAMRDGYPPFVAFGRALESYRLGLGTFPGTIVPYPPGTESDGATVALHQIDGRVVGYSNVAFPDGSPVPAEERLTEEGAPRTYRYRACRPSIPCLVRPE